MRRKLPPLPLPRATEARPLEASLPRLGSYARWSLTQLRALGLAAVALAPLGLAGAVSACGGAAPTRALPSMAMERPPELPAPIESIAPPAAPNGAVPPQAQPSSAAPAPTAGAPVLHPI